MHIRLFDWNPIVYTQIFCCTIWSMGELLENRCSKLSIIDNQTISSLLQKVFHSLPDIAIYFMWCRQNGERYPHVLPRFEAQYDRVFRFQTRTEGIVISIFKVLGLSGFLFDSKSMTKKHCWSSVRYRARPTRQERILTPFLDDKYYLEGLFILPRSLNFQSSCVLSSRK